MALRYRNFYHALISRVTVGHHWSVATVTLCALLVNKSKNLFFCRRFGAVFKLSLYLNKSMLQVEHTDMCPFFKHA